MTLSAEFAAKTIDAEGPEGLSDALNRLWDLAQKDAEFAAQDHYIMYKLGGQRSLIKTNLGSSDKKGKKPEFLYCDTLKRPATATPIVQKIIFAFITEKYDGKDLSNQFHDLYDSAARVSASIQGLNLLLPEDPIAHAYQLLSQTKYPASQSNIGRSRFGMFPPQENQESVNPMPTPSKGMTIK